MKETNLQKEILKYLGYNGIMAWRNNTTGVYDPYKKIFRLNPAIRKGIPDILGVLPCIINLRKYGLALGVECKKEGNKMSEHQKNFRKEFEQAGGIFILAYSLNDVEKELSKWIELKLKLKIIKL